MAIDVSGEEKFKTEVLESKIPVLVDLWAPWCMPCRWYSPIIEDVSEKMKDKIKLVKINVDENQEIATKYGVEAIPTTLLIKDGQVKTSVVGAMQKDALLKWINDNLQ